MYQFDCQSTKMTSLSIPRNYKNKGLVDSKVFWNYALSNQFDNTTWPVILAVVSPHVTYRWNKSVLSKCTSLLIKFLHTMFGILGCDKISICTSEQKILDLGCHLHSKINLQLAFFYKWYHFKAYMNSDIQLDEAAIFFFYGTLILNRVLA